VEKPPNEFQLSYISLGAGRQSTAMAICSALGLNGVKKVRYCLFADTGDEIQDTYDHLDRLSTFLEKYDVQVCIVKTSTLSEDLVKASRGEMKRAASIPAFTPSPTDGRASLLWRQCTSEYKIYPLRKFAKQLLGMKPKERMGKRKMEVLIGISMDEIIRMKPSEEKWETRSYPLIDARLRVEDCKRICMDHLGYVPEKSACRFCPYHDNHFWSWLKKDRPVEFKKACDLDNTLRDQTKKGVKMPVYLHRSLEPLDKVNFDSLIKDPNQMTLDGFGNACDGYCGV